MIRVLICDDQAIVCDGLEAILSTDPEIEVVGLAMSGAQAVELALKTKPDLVLMDLKMPGMNGIQATQAIRDQLPDTRVLVLTTYDADEWVFDAIRSGASGYMLKDTPRSKLIPAIKDTVAGSIPAWRGSCSAISRRITSGSPHQPSPKTSASASAPCCK
jgi:DNA-binding NarL/FixJ family response regulator